MYAVTNVLGVWGFKANFRDCVEVKSPKKKFGEPGGTL